MGLVSRVQYLGFLVQGLVGSRVWGSGFSV